jgi:hypothetical protein
LKFGGTATKAYPHHTPAGKAMFQMMGVFAVVDLPDALPPNRQTISPAAIR